MLFFATGGNTLRKNVCQFVSTCNVVSELCQSNIWGRFVSKRVGGGGVAGTVKGEFRQLVRARGNFGKRDHSFPALLKIMFSQTDRLES
jgi:hypothetical protein